jgi:RNA polymerase sigma-70 factor, ECF subfamily
MEQPPVRGWRSIHSMRHPLPGLGRMRARDRVAAEQRAGFEGFYLRYYDAVLSFVLRRIGEGEAEDVVAETFLAAWRRISDLPGQPLPWLYGTARRVLGNHWRAGRRREALRAKLNGRPSSVEAASLEDPAEYAIDRSQLVAAFNRLSQSDREILALVAWDGLSPEDAASALGCSPGTFTVRLHRARRRLTEHLERPDAAAKPSQAAKL